MRLKVFLALLFCSILGRAQTQPNWTAQVLSASPSSYYNFNDYTTSFLDQITQTTLLSSATGVILPRQQGFDLTQVNNTSASFSYNAASYAPQASIGSVEWSSAFSMTFVLPAFNFARTTGNSQVIFSKGDLSQGNFYEFYVSYTSGAAVPTFLMSGARSGGAAQYMITLPGVDLLNGYAYNFTITNDGLGLPTSVHVFLNGLEPTPPGTSGYGYNYANTGFGGGTITIAGGTGYANSTAFTSSGGSAGCNITGTLNSTGGVPQSVTFTTNYGCIPSGGVPTISLTAPTGTGVSLTFVNTNVSMVSTSLLVFGGYIQGGSLMGNDPSNSASPPLKIDEWAIFPSVVSTATIQSLFTHLKFYQGFLGAVPAVPRYVVVDEDLCYDLDNLQAYQIAIALDRAGYIKVVGVVDEETTLAGFALVNQLLQIAGKGAVPLARPSVFFAPPPPPPVQGNYCLTANINTFNASTSTNVSSYPLAAGMYRQALVNANNAGAPLTILMGGGYRGVMDLMQSPADAVSPLTGSQLMQQNGTNIFVQGLCPTNVCGTGFIGAGNEGIDPVAGQYVFANTNALGVQISSVGGASIPNAGPGTLYTRTAKDPAYLAVVSNGSDIRQAFDAQVEVAFVTSFFNNLQISAPTGTVTVYQPGSSQCVGAGFGSGTPCEQSTTGAGNVHFGLYVTATAPSLMGALMDTMFMNSLINPIPQGKPRSE